MNTLYLSHVLEVACMYGVSLTTLILSSWQSCLYLFPISSVSRFSSGAHQLGTMLMWLPWLQAHACTQVPRWVGDRVRLPSDIHTYIRMYICKVLHVCSLLHNIAHGGVPVLVYSLIIQLYIRTFSCFIMCINCTCATLDLLGPS